MDPSRTALLLIGYQNDYFARDGAVHDLIEWTGGSAAVVENTEWLLERLAASPVTIVSAPILFTPDYRELVEPTGVLAEIRRRRAFQAGTPGVEPIEALRRFGDRILELPGKRGLSAFSNTQLDRVLRGRGIETVVLAGVVTSICVDSTGRSARKRGYEVSVLRDCTSAPTAFEQELYCESVLPLYARVLTRERLLAELGVPVADAPSAAGAPGG